MNPQRIQNYVFGIRKKKIIQNANNVLFVAIAIFWGLLRNLRAHFDSPLRVPRWINPPLLSLIIFSSPSNRR